MRITIDKLQTGDPFYFSASGRSDGPPYILLSSEYIYDSARKLFTTVTQGDARVIRASTAFERLDIGAGFTTNGGRWCWKVCPDGARTGKGELWHLPPCAYVHPVGLNPESVHRVVFAQCKSRSRTSKEKATMSSSINIVDDRPKSEARKLTFQDIKPGQFFEPAPVSNMTPGVYLRVVEGWVRVSPTYSEHRDLGHLYQPQVRLLATSVTITGHTDVAEE